MRPLLPFRYPTLAPWRQIRRGRALAQVAWINAALSLLLLTVVACGLGSATPPAHAFQGDGLASSAAAGAVLEPELAADPCIASGGTPAPTPMPCPDPAGSLATDKAGDETTPDDPAAATRRDGHGGRAGQPAGLASMRGHGPALRGRLLPHSHAPPLA